MKNETKQRLREMLARYRAQGVRYICLDFDGAGDSGSIGDPGFSAHHMALIREPRQEWLDDSDFWIRAAEEAIEDEGSDWYNGDGGFGEVTFDTENHTVHVDMNVRYYQSENTELEINLGLAPAAVEEL